MKTLVVAAITALTLSLPAYATNYPKPSPHAAGFQAKATASAKSYNTAKGGNAYAKGGHANQSQGQVQSQSQKTSQKAVQRTTQANSQTNGQSVNVEGDDFEAAAYAPDAIGFATAPCVKGLGLSFGTVGASGGISIPQESQNCLAERRADQLAAFASAAGLNGGRAGLIYLAGQDPAACVYAKSVGVISKESDCTGRGNAFNQTRASNLR